MLHIDRTKARQLGVAVQDVFDTMQIYLGSLYVNDFNKFGRTYSVRVQADAKYRARPEDIGLLKVRSNTGAMIQLSALLNVKQVAGPERAMRYNGFLTADVNGGAAPGYSSGQAKEAVERIAAETLPKGIGFEWTELTYQEILAGNSGIWVFPLSIFLVFLVLAAQYESLILPLSIIMIVPMGLLAAITGVYLSQGDNNVFTQIGLIVLVGLSAKNAILIVEFARELELAGRNPVQAAIEASRLRLRPILMTSMAFIMGVVPLVTSIGAGAEMRQCHGRRRLLGNDRCHDVRDFSDADLLRDPAQAQRQQAFEAYGRCVRAAFADRSARTLRANASGMIAAGIVCVPLAQANSTQGKRK